jgi:hypothetical protein
MSPCSISRFLYLCSGRLAKQLELSLIFLDSNCLHLNQSKGVRWVWQSSKFACPITLLAYFQEAAAFHEQKGSDSLESSTSSMLRGRFKSMNLRLFINANGTIVGTFTTLGVEQRRDRLWLPRAWPSPVTSNHCYMEGGRVWNRGSAQHPPLPPRTLFAWQPSSVGSIGTPSCTWALVSCPLLRDRRAHIALIVVFGVESRESMTNDIATSTSCVAPSDIELTGSASPDLTPNRL